MNPHVFETKTEYDEWADAQRETRLYRFGDWVFDPDLKRVNDIPITPIQAVLLKVLCEATPFPVSMRAAGQAVGRELGYGYAMDPELIKVHVYRLKRRIGMERIHFVRGVGLLFVAFPVVD